MNFEKKSNLASEIIMIKPTNFGTNYETLKDNKFMQELKNENIQLEALNEFNNAVSILSQNIKVDVYDQCDDEAADSVFPNNWFSTHHNKDIPDGLLIIYPMKSKLRRKERNIKIINDLKLRYKHFEDLSYLENENEYLESTGALIIDEKNKKIFCSQSERATPKALNILLSTINKYSINPYKLVTMKTYDVNNSTIYHTNVMMTILEFDVVICLDSIRDNEERKAVELEVKENRNVINISYEEMNNFCCNLLCLRGKNAEAIVAISKTAFSNMKEENIKLLQKNYILNVIDINIIEKVGGGSARCMLAEIF